jgi:hypothetical protein
MVVGHFYLLPIYVLKNDKVIEILGKKFRYLEIILENYINIYKFKIR